MNDPLISLLKVAAITLVFTLFWAFTLGIAYWDLQRRKQAGQQVNTLVWMMVVAFLPFIGLIGYWLARFISRPAAKYPHAQPGGRRETRFKKPAAAIQEPVIEQQSLPTARKALPTILAADVQKATVLGQQPSVPVETAPPATIRCQFSVTSGPDQGKTFLLSQYPAQIGRDPDSAVRLTLDAGISRKHALVYQINGALRIRDLKSTHGTRVNGIPITDQILRPGDQIQIGQTTILYQEQGN